MELGLTEYLGLEMVVGMVCVMVGMVCGDG